MSELTARPERSHADLHQWALLTSGDYKRLTRHSAMRRAPRAQLQRNALVALGNSAQARSEDADVVVAVLSSSPSPLVRKHAAWALTRLDPERAQAVLSTASEMEADAEVQAELERLVKTLPPTRG
jgi:epoxyqueuosine reductase